MLIRRPALQGSDYFRWIPAITRRGCVIGHRFDPPHHSWRWPGGGFAITKSSRVSSLGDLVQAGSRLTHFTRIHGTAVRTLDPVLRLPRAAYYNSDHGLRISRACASGFDNCGGIVLLAFFARCRTTPGLASQACGHAESPANRLQRGADQTSSVTFSADRREALASAQCEWFATFTDLAFTAIASSVHLPYFRIHATGPDSMPSPPSDEAARTGPSVWIAGWRWEADYLDYWFKGYARMNLDWRFDPST